MGGASSRRRKGTTPIPSYTPAIGTTRGITRPGIPLATGVPLATGGVGNTSVINRDQQRELMQLNQTVANLTNQIQAMQRGGTGAGMGTPQIPYSGYPSPGGMSPQTPYSGYPSPGGMPPQMPYSGYQPPGGVPPQMPYSGYPPTGGMQPSMPYGNQPMFGQSSPSPPPSPLLQHLGGQYPFSYQQQQQQPMMGAPTYRDTDFTSIANIAGLNPSDVAILHREFTNLSRGGTSKIDRVIFRQLLRDVLMQANNEQVDRVIEDMFVTIDRNRDGFIDFPEFVGAFKDVLKQNSTDPQSYFSEHVYPDLLGDQLRAAGVGAGVAPQPITLVQQPQPITFIQQPQPTTQLVSTGGLNIVPLASTGIQQGSFVYGGANSLQFSDATAPFITLDPNQSSYVIATPGQYLITQPTALQLVPLPMM